MKGRVGRSGGGGGLGDAHTASTRHLIRDFGEKHTHGC